MSRRFQRSCLAGRCPSRTRWQWPGAAIILHGLLLGHSGCRRDAMQRSGHWLRRGLSQWWACPSRSIARLYWFSREATSWSLPGPGPRLMADVGWVWERHSTRASGALVHWHDSDMTIFKLRPSGPGHPGENTRSLTRTRSRPARGRERQDPGTGPDATTPLGPGSGRGQDGPASGGSGSLQLETAQWRRGGRGAGQRPAQVPRRRTRRARLGPPPSSRFAFGVCLASG
jgi:hypothetical protein